MQYIKIDIKTFEKLKAAVYDNDIKEISNIVEKIDIEALKKTILRLAYTNYKKTGNRAFLEEYNALKNDFI